MFNYLLKKGVIFAYLCLGLAPAVCWGQECDGQEESLDDTQLPVTGISSANPEAYCLYFRFDSDISGFPTGITMDLWHEYEGDLSIFVEACGERLNVLQRPGAEGNCDEGCSGDFSNCGSAAQIGTQAAPETINFFDLGIEPDFGISAGGSYGLTMDDSCNVSTLTTNTFAELWSNCPEGLVEAEICFTDHAFLHRGYVSNLNFIFPNPYICGCMDPDAINYNPDASVSSGDCYYECPELGLTIPNNVFNLCSGLDTITLAAFANLANDPSFEWFGSGLGTDFLEHTDNASTQVFIPEDFIGSITYTCVVRDAFGCIETETAVLTVLPGPSVSITGDLFVCGNDSTLLVLEGGPYQSILWSNGAMTDSLLVGPGTYSVSVSDGGICTATDMVVINAFDAPMPLISGPDTICALDSTLLMVADTSFVSYLWSNGDTLPFTTVQAAQTYTLEVVDSNGCTGTASFTLEHYPLSPLEIIGPTAFCINDTLTLTATPGFVSYLWSNGDTTLSTQLTQADTLSLMAVDTNGCLAVATQIIDTLPLPSPLVNGPAVLCPGDTATLTTFGGFADYQWSNGSIDSLMMTDTVGTFLLTVVDSMGCSATTDFTITAATLPAPTILGDTVFCVNDSTLLTVDPSFANYFWSSGDTTQQLFVNQAGTYSVTVTNAQGCQGTTSVTLTNYPLDTLLIDGPDEICFGTQATLTAPAGYTDHLWSTGATEDFLVVATTGTYTLEATNANGCRVMGDFAVIVLEEPILEITGDTEICEASTGQLNATPGFVDYVWSETSETASITVDAAQLYSVTATDGNGCIAFASQQVEVSNPEAIIEGENRFCQGESTVLSLTNTFVSYEWSTTAPDATITVDQEGPYSVTVTNDVGCTATADFLIELDTLPQPIITGELNFCTDANTVLDGGMGFAAYEWTGPNNTDQLLTVNTAGTFGLTVTDDNGCTGETSIVTDTFSLPTPAIIGQLDFCPGDSTLLSSAEDYPSYSWSDGSTTPQSYFDNIGQVTLTVTDENGCVGTTSESLQQFSTTIPQIDGLLDFCVGSSTALTVSEVYETYSWSNNESGSTVTFSEPGPVGVTVTDNNGCTTNTATTLNLFAEEPLEILAPAGFCQGEEAVLNASGNFIDYLWSTGETSDEITVSTSEEVTLTGTDANGCEVIASANLEVYNLPAPAIVGPLTFCEGFSTQLGSNENYVSYLWSTQETTATIEVNTEGPIGLTVTDSNGCVGSITENLSTASELTPALSGDNGICPDENTVLFVTEPYATYMWSDGSSEDSLLVDEPGIYTVSVTDQAGCSGEVSLEVIGFANPEVTILGDSTFCAGASTILTAQTPAGSLVWNDGSTLATLEVSTQDDYGFVFTDNNGCQAEAAMQVEELALPEVTIAGPREYCEESSTTLTAMPAFTTYLWNTGEMSASVTVSTSDTLSVIVTDDAGCQNEATAIVMEIPLPRAFAGDAQVLDCDTETAVLGSENTTQGGVDYFWSGPGINTENQGDLFPEVSLPGLYLLQVIDSNLGCMSGVDTVQVTDLSYEPEVVITLLDTLDCTTSSVVLDGSASATGDQFVYQWLNAEEEVIEGANDLELETVLPGMYTLLVVDTVTACVAQEEIMVMANNDYPALEAGDDELLDCETTEATLTGVITSPAASIVQQWTTPTGNILGDPSALIIMADAPGWYYLTATDENNGCVNTDSLLITENTVSPVAITSDDAIIYCNDESVSLQGQGSSQGPVFTYQWWLDNEPLAGGTNLNITIDSPGDYVLVVTNTDNHCTASATTQVTTDPSAPQSLILEFDPPTCFGDEDGSVWVSEVTGGLTPYVYSFAEQNFSSNTSFPGLGAGSYEVVVEDANGCQLSTVATLPDGNNLWVELGDDQRIKEGELVDIIPQLSIDSSLLQSLRWQTLAELSCPDCLLQQDLALATSTQFFLTVTDENGCTAEDLVTIFVDKDRGIYVPNGFSPNGDGRNDRFFVFTDNKSVAEIKVLRIFNRWGEFIWENKNFQPNDPSLGWDGTWRGMDPNPAVYVWYTEILLKSGEVIILKGDVILVE